MSEELQASTSGPDATALPELPETLTIANLEQLRVLSDPLRLRILENADRGIDDTWTVKDVARALGLAPTRLYYHVNLLEEHGLIQVVSSRLVSGILEKRYRAVARSFQVDRKLLSPGTLAHDTAISQLLVSAFDGARQEIEDGLQSGLIVQSPSPEPRRLLLTRTSIALSPERAVELHDRMVALLSEFDDPPADGAGTFGLTVAMYPTAAAHPVAGRRRRRESSEEAS